MLWARLREGWELRLYRYRTVGETWVLCMAGATESISQKACWVAYRRRLIIGTGHSTIEYSSWQRRQSSPVSCAPESPPSSSNSQPLTADLTATTPEGVDKCTPVESAGLPAAAAATSIRSSRSSNTQAAFAVSPTANTESLPKTRARRVTRTATSPKKTRLRKPI